MRKFLFWSLLAVASATLLAAPEQKSTPAQGRTPSQKVARTRIADGFDFPVGKPNADGYYKARGYRPNGHQGEDWNGIKGGDSDLGAPIYSIAHGLVLFARDMRLGWGNVVVIRHVYYEGSRLITIDSLYGHLDSIKVREGQQVLRGQLVGTMGTAHGLYPAHLHFEIHKNLAMGISRTGFAHDFTNYYSPTDFINPRRRLNGGGRTSVIAINTFTDPRVFGPPSNGSAPMRPDPKLPPGASRSSNTNSADVVPPRASSEKRTPTFRVNRFDDLDGS